MKPWLSTEGQSASYDFACTKSTPTKQSLRPHVLPQEHYLDITDSSTASVARLSFPTDPGNYDPLNGLHVNPDHSSPIQSREEAQWHMYLTASLSNPLDSLVFDPRSSPPPLPYSSDVHETNNMSEESLPPMDLFSLPDNSPFPTQALHPSGHYQLPLVDGQPHTSADVSGIHGMFDYNQRTSVNGYREDPAGALPIATDAVANGEYDPFSRLPPSNFDFDRAQVPLSEVSPQATTIIPAVPSPRSTSPPGRFLSLAHPSPVRIRRGLSGWGGVVSPDPLPRRPYVTNAIKKRLRSTSPTVPFSRPRSAIVLSSTADSKQTFSAQDVTRSRQHKTTAVYPAAQGDSHEFELDSNDDLAEDDAESDDYCPSRSPSAAPDDLLQFRCETGTEALVRNKKKAKRSKGKAKGSAALALAVVSQLGASRSQADSEAFDDDFDPLIIYREGHHGIRKRKNHPIPLPVPVPNLNKKSRGRKVPYVADMPSSGGSASPTEGMKGDENDEGGSSRNSGRARRKSSRMPTPVADELSGSRTYVCVVPGCGKCFVRGEHLKRHVRSIHTHDKRTSLLHIYLCISPLINPSVPI